MKKILSILLICWALFPIHSVLAASADTTALPVLSRGHIQDLGDYPADGSWVESPKRIGTVGQSKRIEGFELKAGESLPTDLELRYNVHVQNIGWLYDEDDPTSWAKNGDYAGTRGDGLRIEAIKIVLLDAAGNKASGYHIRYQGHVQNIGDLPADSEQWFTDGEQLGTVGSSLRLEALKLEIVKGATTGTDLSAYTDLTNQIDSLTEADYSKSSWTNLQTVLNNHVVTDKNTTAEVADAVKAIEAAIHQLEKLSTTTAYDKPGIYGPSSGSETISQDVIITSTGVTLQNLTIGGNLIIDEAVGDGEVTLNNVTVTSELRIRGGGKNSIHINGGDYQNILVEKTATGAVRIVATGLDGFPIVLSENAAGETLILEGSFDSVTVNAPDAVIKTQGQTSIKTFDVAAAAQNTAIDLGSTTTVTNLALSSPTKVTGTGTVNNAEIASDNVSFEKAPEDYTVDTGVIVPPVIPTPTPEPPTPQPPTPQPPTPQPPTPQPGKISLSVATAPTVTLSKTYDGSTVTDVTNQILDPTAITGIVAGDDVTVSATATYDNKNVGSNKDITITYSLSGTDATKYTAPTKATISGEIAKANLTVPAPTTTKTYDQTATATQNITPTAGKINGDILTVTETITFDTASAGKDKSVTCSYALTDTDAVNYNVPADQSFDDGEIIAKPISITGTTVETSKTYNRNDGAVVINPGASSNIISGDTVIIEATAYYATSSASTNQPIYVTYTLNGSEAANYRVTYTDPQTLATHPGLSFIKLIDNGVINKVQLTNKQAPSVANKTYDGNATTNITKTAVNTGDISGICSGDTVNLTATASFADANAGVAKQVTITYQITGGSGSENYLPPVNGTATATISPLEFDTTRVIDSPSKEYDGTSTATVNVGLFITDQNVLAIVGPALQNKRITFDISADYTDASGNKTSAVGSNYTIAYSFKLSGPDAGNFKLANSTDNVINGSHPGSCITPKTLTISPPDIKISRTYDGTNKVYNQGGNEIPLSYTVEPSQISGLAAGESLAITATVSPGSKDVGTSTVMINHSLPDNNNGNYLLLPQPISVTITPIQLTVNADSVPAVAITKKYDGTTATDITNKPVTVAGVLSNDTANVTATTTASYNDKNVGPNKPVTITYSLSGDAAKNYLAPVNDTSKTAAITARTLGYTNVVLETMKKNDGTSSAKITSAEIDSTTASGDGVVHHAGSNTLETVYLGNYNADYYENDLSNTTSTTGQHPIVITGTLAGADASNYVMRNYTAPGDILAENAVISTPYNSTNWSVSGTMSAPAANFKLFYAKQAGATTFYGYDSTGQIYSSTDLSNWTTGAQVTLDGKQLIGIGSDGAPIAIATTPDTDQYTNTTHPVYYWTGGAFGSWNNYGTLTNIQPINPTYYTEGATDYLIYQDKNNNVIKRVISGSVEAEIGSYPGPSIPSSFTNSLLVYDGNTLMLYAY